MNFLPVGLRHIRITFLQPLPPNFTILFFDGLSIGLYLISDIFWNIKTYLPCKLSPRFVSLLNGQIFRNVANWSGQNPYPDYVNASTRFLRQLAAVASHINITRRHELIPRRAVILRRSVIVFQEENLGWIRCRISTWAAWKPVKLHTLSPFLFV